MAGSRLLKSLRNRWHGGALRRSLRVLTRADQKKVIAITLIQISMGILDLLGVMAIGLLGALSVTELQSNGPGNRVNSALRLLHISDASFQVQAILIGASAVILLVGRTVLSILFTRRVLFFLSRRGAAISSDLVSRLLSQPLLVVQARTTQETLFAITTGVGIITLQVLGTTVVLASDISLLIILAAGLFVIDPTTAFGTLLVFSLIGYSLYRLLHVRAGMLGSQNSKLTIQSGEKIVEVFSSYRESVVRNRRHFYAREIGKLRLQLADTAAEQNFMPYISKYVIETSVILGALIISVAQFVFQDVTHAVATLAIFLAAGTRIAPAVLRIQQGSLAIRGGIGAAMPTLDLVEMLGNASIVENFDDSVDTVHDGFKSDIQINNVTFTYPNKTSPAISDINLTIPAGSFVAFVGPSGAGKTTVVDVILGVLKTDDGNVLISGLPPLSAVATWPGAISYVPQDVLITAGSIRENVALGYPAESASDELVTGAIRIADLEQFVANLPNGIDTEVGERGARISGGQRQRLGIARAMFTRPHLLVLDEATSALDGESEASVSEAMHSLRGTTTVVMIAHRLSTIRSADIVVYLSEGKVVATGTFSEVRIAVPDFDRQAKLMGL
jgi:ABC-type multidrug transport system fused ATPase/permease subunit